MAETKVSKLHVKKPPKVKKAKPVQNRCGICEHPCTPEKKVHDGCVRRQKMRAKRTSLKMKEGRKETKIASEEAQVKAEEAKQAKAKADAVPDEAVIGKEGN